MSDQNVSRFKGNVSSLDQAAAGDEFARLLEETGKDEVAPLAAGERVQGRIVALGETSFLVDVGQRSEASVAREDFTAEELAAVKVGDVLKKGDLVGATGTTGLTPGDQVHFSVYLAGQPVIPIEWWDGHWIEDNVTAKLRRYAAETPQQ